MANLSGKSMPKVSVIIPAHNAENTILETIISLQKQTLQDIEILVIDDGSKDKTVEVVQQVTDPRVQIFIYPNGGVSVARNRGIEQAKGEFIAFIDSDDLWTEDKLELQLAALEQHPEAGAVYSWTVNMMDNGGPLSFVQGGESTAEGNIYSELLLGNLIGSGSNVLVRREVIDVVGGYESDIRLSDWIFCLRVAAKFNFVVVPKPQVLYRKIAGSLSSRVESSEKQGLRALERAYQMAPPEFQYLKNQSLAFLYRHLADLSLTYNTDAKGLDYTQNKLWQAVKLYPPILYERYAQKLIIKLLIKRALPRDLSNLVIQSVKKQIARPDPRA
jgi:glycosyltransferase involved in cell wall biosynthesis